MGWLRINHAPPPSTGQRPAQTPCASALTSPARSGNPGYLGGHPVRTGPPPTPSSIGPEAKLRRSAAGSRRLTSVAPGIGGLLDPALGLGLGVLFDAVAAPDQAGESQSCSDPAVGQNGAAVG